MEMSLDFTAILVNDAKDGVYTTMNNAVNIVC